MAQPQRVADLVHRHPLQGLTHVRHRHRIARADVAARRQQRAQQGALGGEHLAEQGGLEAGLGGGAVFLAHAQHRRHRGGGVHQGPPGGAEVLHHIGFEQDVGVQDLAGARVHHGRPDGAVARLVRGVPAQRGVADVFGIGAVGQRQRADRVAEAGPLERLVPRLDTGRHVLAQVRRHRAVDVVGDRLARLAQPAARRAGALQPPAVHVAREERGAVAREVLVHRHEVAHAVVAHPRRHGLLGQRRNGVGDAHRHVPAVGHRLEVHRLAGSEGDQGADVHVAREHLHAFEIAAVAVHGGAARRSGARRHGLAHPRADVRQVGHEPVVDVDQQRGVFADPLDPRRFDHRRGERQPHGVVGGRVTGPVAVRALHQVHPVAAPLEDHDVGFEDVQHGAAEQPVGADALRDLVIHHEFLAEPVFRHHQVKGARLLIEVEVARQVRGVAGQAREVLRAGPAGARRGRVGSLPRRRRLGEGRTGGDDQGKHQGRTEDADHGNLAGAA